MNSLTIVIVGGGTGGHLIPNVVIGKIIRRQFPHATVIHIGGTRPLETQVFKSNNISPLYQLHAKQFSGKSLWEKITSVLQVLRNMIICIRWYLAWRPTLVIGVGGYVSIGAILAAWLLRKKIVLQEQNAIPGLANRVLAQGADKILLGFEETRTCFKSEKIRNKCIFSGNFNLARLPQHTPATYKASRELQLLITGGSQGAKTLNEVLAQTLPEILQRFPALTVFWQCGIEWEKNPPENLSAYIQSHRLTLKGFEDNLFHRYEESDVCIARAGALTIEDIICSTCPAILVPYPSATNNHQLENARYLANQDAAVIVEQTKVGWENKLIVTLTRLLTDDLARVEMKEQLKALRLKHHNNSALQTTISDLIK